MNSARRSRSHDFNRKNGSSAITANTTNQKEDITISLVPAPLYADNLKETLARPISAVQFRPPCA
jgi:hypothetical protein